MVSVGNKAQYTAPCAMAMASSRPCITIDLLGHLLPPTWLYVLENGKLDQPAKAQGCGDYWVSLKTHLCLTVIVMPFPISFAKWANGIGQWHNSVPGYLIHFLFHNAYLILQVGYQIGQGIHVPTLLGGYLADNVLRLP